MVVQEMTMFRALVHGWAPGMPVQESILVPREAVDLNTVGPHSVEGAEIVGRVDLALGRAWERHTGLTRRRSP